MGRIPSQDWEQVFQDFRGTSEARNKWLSHYTPTGILEQALQAAARKEFTLKLQILAFLEENAALIIQENSALDLLLDTLRSSLQSSSPASNSGDSSSSANSSTFKEQLMITTTSTMITLNALSAFPRSLESLVELLLTFINRPNHSAERHLRATACECLRQLEIEFPCLLHSSAGHLLGLCQSERTHAVQSYTLLLTSVLENSARFMGQIRQFSTGTYSILSTSLPLVPFSVPGFITNGFNPGEPPSSSKHFSRECMQEFRRVISFLLEKPNLLTEFSLLEFISGLCRIASCLELQGGLLRHQFWAMLHLYTPVSCHALLTIFTRFPESFEGEEEEIYKRLVLFSREFAQALTIRLLALHWLRGLETLVVSRGREPLLASVSKALYPEVFDPLSLKAAKLDCLARCATIFDQRGCSENGVHVAQESEAGFASELLADGLVCLSSYKWLPSGSTETRLVFHTLHRFLVYGLPHSREKVADRETSFLNSMLFKSLQENLVDMARNVRRLVDRILGLLDRFLDCEAHRGLGEWLLRTFSEKLVPSLPCSLSLPAYFPLMERIAESSTIPPGGLVVSLGAYIRNRVGKDSGHEAGRLWLRGSEVLMICRSLLVHHPSSRIFSKLSGLLGYMCLSFPDIEVRDNARFYLRLLISVPGNKLREILMYCEEKMEDSKPQLLHVSSFLSSPSPRAYQGKKQSSQLSSFIHLTRETPLLVRSSWSLVLHDSFRPVVETFPEPKQAGTPNGEIPEEDEGAGAGSFPETLNPEPVPRVMDAKTAEALSILRRHFSEVPDSGVKIEVLCRLKLKVLPELDSGDPETSGIYAVVISFSTSGLYGPIPDVRVSYLRSEPSLKARSPSSRQPEEDETEFLEREKQRQEVNGFSEVVRVVLEPKQPVPSLVDCHIVFTDEDAQTVHGQLESLCVGMEDLFMKPPVPEDVGGSSERLEYLSGLFDALWFGCSGPGILGTEIFLLKGGRQGVGLRGSETSVKLLEAQADRVVAAVENYLAEFVVSVSGSGLKQMAEDSGKFVNALMVDDEEEELAKDQRKERRSKDGFQSGGEEAKVVAGLELSSPSSLDIQRAEEERIRGDGELGCFLVLVFLPPRYHLLLRMEVSEWSTMVRIRTDYWPSLAHVDEFLESFITPAVVTSSK